MGLGGELLSGELQYLKLSKNCGLIFGFKDDHRNRFASFRVEPPCQSGGVVLKMTALDERIRRPESFSTPGSYEAGERQTLANLQFLVRCD
jgi:hypothetical protein